MSLSSRYPYFPNTSPYYNFASEQLAFSPDSLIGSTPDQQPDVKTNQIFDVQSEFSDPELGLDEAISISEEEPKEHVKTPTDSMSNEEIVDATHPIIQQTFQCDPILAGPAIDSAIARLKKLDIFSLKIKRPEGEQARDGHYPPYAVIDNLNDIKKRNYKFTENDRFYLQNAANQYKEIDCSHARKTAASLLLVSSILLLAVCAAFTATVALPVCGLVLGGAIMLAGIALTAGFARCSFSLFKAKPAAVLQEITRQLPASSPAPALEL